MTGDERGAGAPRLRGVHRTRERTSPGSGGGGAQPSPTAGADPGPRGAQGGPRTLWWGWTQDLYRVGPKTTALADPGPHGGGELRTTW